jgi:hypothetical protein
VDKRFEVLLESNRNWEMPKLVAICLLASSNPMTHTGSNGFGKIYTTQRNLYDETHWGIYTTSRRPVTAVLYWYMSWKHLYDETHLGIYHVPVSRDSLLALHVLNQVSVELAQTSWI